MKKVILALCLVLAGCERAPISTDKTNNPEITLSLLFEHDGVKVFRFYDNGRAIYFVDGRGSVQWTDREGKVKVKRQVDTIK